MPDTTPISSAASSSRSAESTSTVVPSQLSLLGEGPASQTSRPRRPMARVLEPRVLYDAAAATTAAVVADQAATDSTATDSSGSTADPALFAAPAVEVRREAYVIDKGVQGYQALLDQVPQGAEIFLIDNSSSGFAQLNTLLASTSQPFDAIHIISHGDDGAVQLGGDVLRTDNVGTFQSALQTLGTHLTANGDLLLYGCDVAKTDNGQQLLQRMADYTGADVAASTDDTGGPGGNTSLEAHAGSIESDPWAAPNLLNDPLTLYSLSGGVETGSVNGESLGRAIDASGDWVVAGANGSVQLWKVAGTTRTETVITKPADGISSADFGAAVGIDMASNGSTGTLVVADRNAGTAGYLYVYRLNSGSWTLTASLNIAATATGTRIGQDWNATYRTSQWLAVSGTHIAVGLPTEGSGTGRIIWYEENSTGAFTAFTAGVMDEIDTGGTSQESFGASLDMAGGVLVVGAPTADINGQRTTSGFASWSSSVTQIAGNNHGAVFVYNWSSGGSPSYANIRLEGNGDTSNNAGTNGNRDAVAGALFGSAVAIEYYAVPHTDGTAPTASEYKYTIVAGAPAELSDAGEIYIYQSNDNNMILNTASTTTGFNPYRVLNIRGLTGTDWNGAGEAPRKGTEVSVSQGTVLIASTSSTATTQNAVYVLRSKLNDWYTNGTDTNNPGTNYEYQLFKSNQSPITSSLNTDRYGTGATLVGGAQLVIGSPLNDQAGTDRGTVVFYFVRLPYAAGDYFNISEDDGTVTFDVRYSTTTGSAYANDGGDDVYGSLTDAQVQVSGAQAVSKGTLVWPADSGTDTGNVFTYNPNAQFEYLGAGQTETVYLSYVTKNLTGTPQDGFISQANVVITINGKNDAPIVGAQLDNVTVPRSNAGTTTFSSVIPITAFNDVDQNALLTYAVASITPVGGAPAMGIATNNGSGGTSPTGAGIAAWGQYNVANQANTGAIYINTSGLTPAQVGTGIAYDVVVRATDDQGASTTQTIRVYIAPDNVAPTSTAVPAQTATEDVTFTLDLRDGPTVNSNSSDAWFKDADITGNDVTVATASFNGTVMTVTGGVTGTFAVGQEITGAGIPDGTTIVALGTGTGGAGTYTLSTNVGTIAAEAVTADYYNTYTTPAAPDVPVAPPYTEQLTFTIVAQSGPGADWLTVSADGVLAGSPSNDNVGLTKVIVRATDIFGKYTEQTIQVTVGNANDAPVLGYEIERQSAIRGSAYSFNIQSGAGAASSVTHTAPYNANPNFYFYDWDNYTGRYDVDTFVNTDTNAAPAGSGLTFVNGSFTQLDVGKTFTLAGAGAGGTTLTGTIASVLSSTSITLSTPIVTATAAGATFTYYDPARTPSAGNTVTYTAFNPVDNDLFGTTGTGAGNAAVGNDLSWLSFDGTTFTGTPPTSIPLGTILTVGLRCTDSLGAVTETTFELGVFPPDQGGETNNLPTPDNGQRLGYDVAINSGNAATGAAQGAPGRWAVVGMPGANNGAGAIYIYQNTNAGTANSVPAWTQVATFAGAADSGMGTSVDISADGLRIVAGAPFESNGAGAVYYFTNNGSGVWTANATAKGTSPDANAGDHFGQAVAVALDPSDSTYKVLVGAPLDDAAGVNAGAAYKFNWGSATGAGKLTPVADTTTNASDSTTGDMFGFSVAYDQEMMVVGAPRDDVQGLGATSSDSIEVDAGSVYVFKADTPATYVKLMKPVAEVRDADYFGYSVDLDSFGSTRGSLVVAVGVPGHDIWATDSSGVSYIKYLNAGAVYIYRSDAIVSDSPAPLASADPARVVAFDPRLDGGFGTSVAIDANENTGTDNSSDPLHMVTSGNFSSGGTVYALRYKSSVTVNYGWVGQRYVVADGDPGLASNQAVVKLGNAVDIGGLTLLAGAPETTRTGGTNYDGTGTTQYNAGNWFGWGLNASGTGTSPIELSGSLPKTEAVDDGWTAGVGSGSGAGSDAGSDGLSSLMLLDDEEWKRLLTPVTDWTPQVVSSKVPVLLPATRERFSYSDELLFDARTLGRQVAANTVEGGADVKGEDSDKPAGKAATEKHADKPGKEKAAPGKHSPDAHHGKDSHKSEEGQGGKPKGGEAKVESRVDAATLSEQLYHTATTHSRNAGGLLNSLKTLAG